ncbi:hypothetical protein EDB86DRAFT_2983896 [Lactarius hatsudake]|nr:hypothetical protein EDB86DRAFT_2983896 [Lactarius hatsudake]
MFARAVMWVCGFIIGEKLGKDDGGAVEKVDSHRAALVFRLELEDEREQRTIGVECGCRPDSDVSCVSGCTLGPRVE